MSDWDTLFYDEKNIEMIPELEVFKFVEFLKREYPGEKFFGNQSIQIYYLVHIG
ncbi:hypothetical protein I580_01230 [Enterococcus caccae ATCC BAA-1240]|uniref:Uncharacterized protein n=1 Tax=Enterococcus caccae ATCC BAA-1240 TaxID=1158612 RepID=R3WIK2_9ENTE|nr:hypothetical protein UC7_00926 [Enterococcus caccae ATCC BAA-1240]EOT65474.1 hypothetical protein I580_01230 [Enterococcus caccae ATCC BAA-1240]